jgi:isopentenyldiphosphate isomerase
MSAHPPIQVVNQNDEPVNGQSLQTVHDQGLIHRVIHVIVEDEHGHILLQKRSSNLSIYPNCWDISVGGHVDLGEGYQETATRELQEELGLSGLQLVERGHYYYELTINNKLLKRFATDFKATISHDTPIHFPPDEISAVQWQSVAEIKQLIKAHPDMVANGLVDSIARYYAEG